MRKHEWTVHASDTEKRGRDGRREVACRYGRQGIGNYLQVLSAETPLLAQQSLDADLRSRQIALEIDLVRALGGGFDAAVLSVAAAH